MLFFQKVFFLCLQCWILAHANPLFALSEAKILESQQLLKNFIEHPTHQGIFSGKENISLNYRVFLHKNTLPQTKNLFLIGGRGSSYIYYQEFIYDLYQQHHNIHVFDQRGFGFSPRLTKDTEKSHVEDFQDYIEDFQKFLEFIGLKDNAYLITGSMGALVSLEWSQKYHYPFKGVVLLAPMVAPKLPAKLLLEPLVNVMCLLGFNESYAWGQKGYDSLFNPYTSSHNRFKFRQLLAANDPTLKNGGSTFQWIREVLKIKPVYSWKYPTKVFLGEDDPLLDIPKTQDFFKDSLENKENLQFSLDLYSKGLHDLINERDPIRNSIMKKIQKFFYEKS